ncbi:MAG: TAXI family TRAP transporter solute-binding subunit, partial [Alphaproteobacteria bacterium]|nr:TAXI family TRAP transporter solute-binding subunit [Alphaproteobacteria bacterium]
MNLRMLAAATVVAGMAAPALAADLPKTVTLTAYGTTSSGYAQSIAIGAMLKQKHGVELRVIPGKNDVSRMIPVKKKRAHICACGIAAAFTQEGVYLFGSKAWGPMAVRNLYNNAKGPHGLMPVVAGDAGIKVAADLKGKKMAWIKGAPALNVNLTALMAFGGVTWDDVTKVEFPGWKQGVDGVIGGQADAVMVSTMSPHVNRLMASPRGSWWVSLPPDDKEGWARAKAVAPFWNPNRVTLGIGLENNITGEAEFDGQMYPYPIVIGLADDLSDDFTYAMTKAVMEGYDGEHGYGTLKGTAGYQLSAQNLTWVFPYAGGSVRYYKEAGAWGADQEAHNNALLKRQDVLIGAWKTYYAANKDM